MEWVSWWKSEPVPTTTPDIVNTINKVCHHFSNSNEKGGVSFTVIHTNWYNRQQVRILQFGDTEFKRFHPKVAEPKAIHKYTDVQKVALEGDSIFSL